jgi:hypothetical protein
MHVYLLFFETNLYPNYVNNMASKHSRYICSKLKLFKCPISMWSKHGWDIAPKQIPILEQTYEVRENVHCAIKTPSRQFRKFTAEKMCNYHTFQSVVNLYQKDGRAHIRT